MADLEGVLLLALVVGEQSLVGVVVRRAPALDLEAGEVTRELTVKVERTSGEEREEAVAR